MRDYQRRIVEELQSRNPVRVGLFLGMGAGKTRIVLETLSDKHFPALVIAPKRVAEVAWGEEITKWRPEVRWVQYSGDKNHRQATNVHGADIVLSSVHNFQELSTKNFRTIIVDEISAFKTLSAKRTKALLKMRSENFIGMTGTPMANSIEDIFSVMLLIDRGESLGRSITKFRGQFMTSGYRLPNGAVVGREERPGARDMVAELIQGSVITEADIAPTPGVVREVVVVPKDKAQERVAGYLMHDYRGVGEPIFFKEEPLTAASAAGKLLQIDAGSVYADGKVRLLSNFKIDEAYTWALTQPGCLMLYNFRFEKDYLVGKRSVVTLEDPQWRSKWDAGCILLAHPASIGHGMNLQGNDASMCWLSPTTSPELRAQAEKRLDRPGRKTKVVCKYFVSGGLDLAVHDRLNKKSDLEKLFLERL